MQEPAPSPLRFGIPKPNVRKEHVLSVAGGLEPHGLVFDAAGNLWVSMTQQLCRLRPNGRARCWGVIDFGVTGAPVVWSAPSR